MDSTDTVHGKAVRYWIDELEDLKAGYVSLLRNENPVYKEQLKALEENHAKKIAVLQKWREDKLAFIKSESEKKIELLKSECERHKKDIPKLLERSIRQQFEQLQQEFPDVFKHLTGKGIPFIDTFGQQEATRVFMVELNKQHLGSREIRADFEQLETERNQISVENGKLVLSGNGFLDVGDSVSVTIGQFQTFTAVISDIGSDYVEFMKDGSTGPVRVCVEALQLSVVGLRKSTA